MNDEIPDSADGPDPAEGSIAAEKARRAQRRPAGARPVGAGSSERPSHPPVAAAVLMVGIVVLVFLLSYLSVR